MNNIYLVGFMGTGKSSVAKNLMNLLPCKIVEMDSAIEALACMPIPQIFEKMGEKSFRDMESMLLTEIAKEKNQIVSCGGGVILRQENIDTMKNSGTVIRLNASAKTIYDRTVGNENRPLLADKKSVEDIEKMMAQREEFYQKAAEYTVDCDTMSPAEIAAEIVKILALNGLLV